MRPRGGAPAPEGTPGFREGGAGLGTHSSGPRYARAGRARPLLGLSRELFQLVQLPPYRARILSARRELQVFAQLVGGAGVILALRQNYAQQVRGLRVVVPGIQ